MIKIVSFIDIGKIRSRIVDAEDMMLAIRGMNSIDGENVHSTKETSSSLSPTVIFISHGDFFKMRSANGGFPRTIRAGPFISSVNVAEFLDAKIVISIGNVLFQSAIGFRHR